MRKDPRPALYQKIRNYVEKCISDACEVEGKKDDVYYEFHIFEDMKNVIMFIDGNKKVIERVGKRLARNFIHNFNMDINVQGTHYKIDRSYNDKVRMGVYLARDFHSFDMNHSIAEWGKYNGEYIFLNIYPYYEYADDYLNPDYNVKGETREHKHIENIGILKDRILFGECDWNDYVEWFEKYYNKELYKIDYIERRLNI